MEKWGKAISRERDRRQSRVLAWGMGVLLALAACAPAVVALKLGLPLRPLAGPLVFSCAFAALVWGLRAATAGGVATGWLVCFLLAQSREVWTRFSPLPAREAIPALIALFLLTFAATRFGREKKEARGLAEPRQGRRASQVAANLGVAALFAAAGRYEGCIAALAEAAADTVSSEVGQAVGGRALLITTLRQVPAGTDGGVSGVGTIAGVVAAGVIVGVGRIHHALWPNALLVMAAACLGLLFDSLLGATVERWGWVGNDVVNLASTLFAAAVAEGLKRAMS